MVDQARAFIDLISRLQPGESPFHAAAARAFFAFAETTPNQLDDLARFLLPELQQPDTHHASCVAISCGTLAELGADPAIAGVAIVGRFYSAAQRGRLGHEAIVMFDRGAMAHLCRSVAVRRESRAIRGLDECLAAVDRVETVFTRQVLGFVDDLELLVLVPSQRKGFRVRLEAIATNAHFFTLLQAELIDRWRVVGHGEPIDRDVVAVATGQRHHDECVIDQQRFHFSNWTGLATTGVEGELRAWIPVDGSPRDIPALPDGRRVVVVKPPLVGGRSWDSNFFANIHDALRSRVDVIDELSLGDVDAALAEIAALH